MRMIIWQCSVAVTNTSLVQWIFNSTNEITSSDIFILYMIHWNCFTIVFSDFGWHILRMPAIYNTPILLGMFYIFWIPTTFYKLSQFHENFIFASFLLHFMTLLLAYGIFHACTHFPISNRRLLLLYNFSVMNIITLWTKTQQASLRIRIFKTRIKRSINLGFWAIKLCTINTCFTIKCSFNMQGTVSIFWRTLDKLLFTMVLLIAVDKLAWRCREELIFP